jgi:hypothetical protein
MTAGMAIAWYLPASWRQLQAVAGADTLCTYDAFVKKTEDLLRGFRAQGVAAEKVPIEVDHMAAWCKRHGYPISDGGSRAAYGAMLAMHEGKPFDLDAPVDDAGLLPRTQ